MSWMKEGLLAVLATLWITGLVAQIGSWPMVIGYLLISFAMVAFMLGERAVPRLARLRNRRR